MKRVGGVVFFCWLLACMPARAQEDPASLVSNELAAEEVWSGERLRMTVTLRSPGPFSGTAVFRIPRIPGTIIVKQGRPLIGSAQVGGESIITQQHDFDVYTQQVGVVEIPGFPVLFESKDGFIGEAKERKGVTRAVAFRAKRPPGWEDGLFVVSSSTLSVEQSWDIPEVEDLVAGDVVSRVITRRASDTSAMFLPPIVAEPIPGARIYLTEPAVLDKVERGHASAERIDTIRYQFERGGRFEIPDAVITWWDPVKEEVRTQQLAGMDFDVEAPPVATNPEAARIRAWRVAGFLLLFVAIVWAGRKPVRKLLKRARAEYHSPLASARRELRRACRSGDAGAAYRAWLRWHAASGNAEQFGAPFAAWLDCDEEFAGFLEEVTSLESRLFARDPEPAPWSGGYFWEEFRKIGKRWPIRGVVETEQRLVPLNFP